MPSARGWPIVSASKAFYSEQDGCLQGLDLSCSHIVSRNHSAVSMYCVQRHRCGIMSIIEAKTQVASKSGWQKMKPAINHCCVPNQNKAYLRHLSHAVRREVLARNRLRDIDPTNIESLAIDELQVTLDLYKIRQKSPVAVHINLSRTRK